MERASVCVRARGREGGREEGGRESERPLTTKIGLSS